MAATIKVSVPARECTRCAGAGMVADGCAGTLIDKPERTRPCPNCKGSGDEPGSKTTWHKVKAARGSLSLTDTLGHRDGSFIEVGQRGTQVFTIYRLRSRYSDDLHMIAVRVREFDRSISDESQASTYELAARLERGRGFGANWALCVDGTDARLHIEDTEHNEAQNAGHLDHIMRALRAIGVV